MEPLYGKVKRGEEIPWSKLTEEDVRLIRELCAERRRLLEEADRLTYRKIAEKFGVSESCVQRIVYRERWGHVR